MRTVIEILKNLSNRYYVENGRYVIYKEDLDASIEEIELLIASNTQHQEYMRELESNPHTHIIHEPDAYLGNFHCGICDKKMNVSKPKKYCSDCGFTILPTDTKCQLCQCETTSQHKPYWVIERIVQGEILPHIEWYDNSRNRWVFDINEATKWEFHHIIKSWLDFRKDMPLFDSSYVAEHKNISKPKKIEQEVSALDVLKRHMTERIISTDDEIQTRACYIIAAMEEFASLKEVKMPDRKQDEYLSEYQTVYNECLSELKRLNNL